MKASRPTSRGFTLIEAMVAMAILGVAVAATIPLLTLSINRAAHARKVTGAQYLAQDLLERLRAEVRYDSTGASPSTVLPADAWRFDVLPHSPDTASAAAACQPAGLDDGIEYDHGPFVFRREDQNFSVCYRLTLVKPTSPAHANLPPTSMEAQVRILWRSPGAGWSSWSLSDLLVSGA